VVNNKWILLYFLVIIMIFILIPINFLSASPENLITNGDFQTGDFSGWNQAPAPGLYSVNDMGGGNFAAGLIGIYPIKLNANLWQIVNNVTTPNLNFSYRISIDSTVEHRTYVELRLWSQNGTHYLDTISDIFYSITDGWRSFNYNLLQRAHTDISALDTVWVIEATSNNSVLDGSYQGYYDDFKLEKAPLTIAEPVWVRTQEMTCKRVWINEDNMFQFSFIYPYADNNWVRIYDMRGKEVYSIDMPYDNPNIIVDLPDGMYTVKTFHDQAEPLQEFIIGKP
jgi:hypothetical protein